MKRNATIRTALGALSIALLAGCQDATGPVPVGTTFVLVQVGGDGLPTSLTTGAYEAVAIADTIVFVAEPSGHSGTVEHHETIQYTTGTYHSIYRRSYAWRDGVLTFLPPPCPPGASCLRFIPETGHLESDALTITYDDALLRTRTYRRLS
jgi:hypothetical protein